MPLEKLEQRKGAYAFGVIFVIVILGIAIGVPNPTSFQYTVFRIVLALAAAGVAAMIPGFINVTVGTAVRAGGAIAVFVIVFFFSPANLVVQPTKPNDPDQANTNSPTKVEIPPSSDNKNASNENKNTSPNPVPVPVPTSVRVKVGGNFDVKADGCQNTAQEFRVEAPGKLDTSKGGQGGAPNGWDIEASGNGSHGVRGISVAGNTLIFTLHAEGGGSTQTIPLKGTVCVSPTGANSSSNIYAYVFQN